MELELHTVHLTGPTEPPVISIRLCTSATGTSLDHEELLSARERDKELVRTRQRSGSEPGQKNSLGSPAEYCFIKKKICSFDPFFIKIKIKYINDKHMHCSSLKPDRSLDFL